MSDCQQCNVREAAVAIAEGDLVRLARVAARRSVVDEAMKGKIAARKRDLQNARERRDEPHDCDTVARDRRLGKPSPSRRPSA